MSVDRDTIPAEVLKLAEEVTKDFLVGGEIEPFIRELEAFAARAIMADRANRPATAQPGAAVEEALRELRWAHMPSYGEVPFDQLREAVSEANVADRHHLGPFDPDYYPGHQIVGGLNYNSLNRIVTTFVRAALSPAKSEADIRREAAEDEPVHAWFGLTYSSYAVLPRLAMQAMPLEWQREFVRLMDQAEAAGVVTPDYHVLRDEEGYTAVELSDPDDETSPPVQFTILQADEWANYRRGRIEKVCPTFRARHRAEKAAADGRK